MKSGGFLLLASGAALATRCIEPHVFRASLLSIVISLAVGQNVSLLCRTWCAAEAAGAGECHHTSSSPRPMVAGEKSCDNVVTAGILGFREDVRRGVSSHDPSQAIPVPRYQLTELTIDARRGQEPWRKSSLDGRPLSVALRI